MFNIREQIELFADPAFSPKVEAQRFFAANGEADVARKLNEMTGIQVNSIAYSLLPLTTLLTAAAFRSLDNACQYNT